MDNSDTFGVSPFSKTEVFLHNESFPQLEPGQVFGNYRVIHELGRGGMAIVYKAYDTRINRIVALKILYQNTSDLDQDSLLKETKILASMDHPNIVKIFDVGTTPVNYFTMEYIEGNTLGELIRKNQVSINDSIKVVAKIANALQYAHKANILHRDIKPDNIMIATKGDVKLMDFGVAKVTDQQKSLTQKGRMVGTPAYSSKEQINGDATKASDIYSLGVVLYECITGNRPFSGRESLQIIYNISLGKFTLPREHNPKISKYIEAICLKCMNKSPRKRYNSAKALEKDLRNFLENKPIEAKSYTTVDRVQKFIIGHKLLCSILATIILLLFSWIYFLYQKSIYNEQQLTYLQKIDEEKKELQKLTNTLFDVLDYMMGPHANVFADPVLSGKMISIFKQNLNIELEQDRIISIRGIILASSEDENDLKQAIEDFSYYLEKKPTSADRYNSRGMVYRKLKEYDKAISDYDKAISIEPKYTYYFNKGVIYDVQEKYIEAVEEYNKAISLNPRYFIAVASRGTVYEKKKRYDLAIQDYTTALQLEVPKGLNSQSVKQEIYQRIQSLKTK